jgi:RNA polymerase sigma-70 factor (ECF subfamily)
MSGALSVEINELLQRIATGDRQAFRVLYAKAGPRLYGICLRMMRARDLADDVYQEACVKIWERSWQFDPAKGDGMAWLAILTRHCALDRLRRAPRQQVAIDEAVSAEIDASYFSLQPDQADMRGLEQCLSALREDYRSAVVLAYVNGLTHDELAQRLNRPLGTIKSWVKRGLDQLKDCMDS